MSRKQVRKMIRKLGGTPDASTVERTEFSVNASEAEKRSRMEQARERGILGVPIDPRSVEHPAKWYEGRPLQTRRPSEIEQMREERRRSGGDRFR